MRELPVGEGWQYEPKWDGFRGVLENLDGELALWSRSGRPLLRYFPELRPLGEMLPPLSALDGEVVIVRNGALDFDAMQMRLHPAESRIRRLSAEIPAEFVAFDLLVWEGEPVWERPLGERRGELERRARGFRLSPATGEVARGARLARTVRGARPRRGGREASRLAVPARLPGRDGQGEGAQVGRLCRHGHPLEGIAGGDRDPAARPLPRGRRNRLRRVVRGRREDPRRGCRQGAAAARAGVRGARVGAEPLGERRARGGVRAARARRRGALRQGAGEPVPPRDEADPLAGGQGSALLHVA